MKKRHFNYAPARGGDFRPDLGFGVIGSHFAVLESQSVPNIQMKDKRDEKLPCRSGASPNPAPDQLGTFPKSVPSSQSSII